MFHYFTIKFHFSFFASFCLFSLQIFRFKFFASLHLSNFSLKRNKAKRISSLFFRFFAFFHFFFHFFSLFFRIFSHFFCFFLLFFARNFSLRFDLVIFASKRSEIQGYLFAFFAFFHFFSASLRFASIFSLNFRLFYLRFRVRFLVFFIEVNHVKTGFFSLPSETKFSLQFSNFASEAKVRAHPSRDGLDFNTGTGLPTSHIQMGKPSETKLTNSVLRIRIGFIADLVQGAKLMWTEFAVTKSCIMTLKIYFMSNIGNVS